LAFSLLKPSYGDFIRKTATWIQKWFKISVKTSRKLYCRNNSFSRWATGAVIETCAKHLGGRSWIYPADVRSLYSTIEGGSAPANRCFKTPAVITTNTGYRKGLPRNLGCRKAAAFFLHVHVRHGPRAVEVKYRRSACPPDFSYLIIREKVPASWNTYLLVTEPPSSTIIAVPRPLHKVLPVPLLFAYGLVWP
jgi:hypothetical protein